MVFNYNVVNVTYLPTCRSLQAPASPASMQALLTVRITCESSRSHLNAVALPRIHVKYVRFNSTIADDWRHECK